MTAGEMAPWIDGRPNLQPTEDFQGLKAGDRINVLWTEDSDPVPATVQAATAFGARVLVDPTGDPGWNCGPFEMYVTQQTSTGSWAR